MTNTPRRHRRLMASFMAVLFLVAASASAALISATAGAAGDEVDPETGNQYHSADLHHGGRFTGPGEVWPPRPVGASAPSLVPEATIATGDSVPFVAQIATTDTAVASALGADWVLISADSGITDGKGVVDNSRAEVHYFSNSNNQTVTATITAGYVESYTTIPAAEYQPALAASEVQRAVDLARAHWVNAGATDIDELEGFAIRAFTADEQFHDVRMAYVSFHESADTLPVYLANVDLTNGSVADARVDS